MDLDMDPAALPLPLLDLLEHLPAPALRKCFWPLLPRGTKKALRLTSRRSLRLAEQLNSCFQLGFQGNPDPSDDTQLMGRALGRHEHIEVLKINECSPEEVVVTGLQLGRAGVLRVREVQVMCGFALTHRTGSALAASCPALRTVDAFGVRGDLDASFFTALQELSHLAEVKLNDMWVSPCVIRSLAHLPALELLHLVDSPEPDDVVDSDEEMDEVGVLHGRGFYVGFLPDLALMTNLRSLLLEAAMLGDPAVFEQLTLLRSLTQLMCLDVKPADDHPFAELAPPGRQGPGDRALNAVLGQLGPLRRLQSLRISYPGSVVNCGGFEGLRQLTALTKLQVDGVRLEHPACAGALPRLCELHLAITVSPAQLLGALQAMHPLPSLALIAVHVGISSSGGGGGGVGTQTGEAVKSAELAALRAAAQHLAAAPQLAALTLSLRGGFSEHDSDSTTLTAALAALAAVRQHLQALDLFSFSRGQLSGLQAALAPYPRLTKLEIRSCSLGLELLDLALHAHTLRHLSVSTRSSMSALAMAFVTSRQQPLALIWSPLPASELEVIRDLIAAQGKEHISIHEYAPYTHDFT